MRTEEHQAADSLPSRGFNFRRCVFHDCKTDEDTSLEAPYSMVYSSRESENDFLRIHTIHLLAWKDGSRLVGEEAELFTKGPGFGLGWDAMRHEAVWWKRAMSSDMFPLLNRGIFSWLDEIDTSEQFIFDAY